MRTLVFILSIAILMGVAGYGMWYRFSHPELTETQLFMQIWYLVPIAIVGMIGSSWGKFSMPKRKDKK